MTDQGEKECSTPRKPKNCIVLYCTRIVYLSSNTFLSLRGRHKKGRGGEGEKSAKGKREREPFLLSSITSFTPPSVWPTTPATYFPRLFKKRATNFNCQKRKNKVLYIKNTSSAGNTTLRTTNIDIITGHLKIHSIILNVYQNKLWRIGNTVLSTT